MIGNSKPLASLSSGLLARKGQAKPAMRPQGFVSLNPGVQEDLGWNDMGDETPAPAPKPVVLRQREVLDAKLAAPAPETKPEAKPAPRAAVGAKGKAAFTLRLDQERHLRLRLASAVTHRSAQQLVTEALDQFLDSLTEVDALARQLGPARTVK
jgi:hypothetical protein